MRFTMLSLAFLCMSVTAAHSQFSSVYKFEKITAADFAPTVYAIDSSAEAIILADVGSTEFEGNSKGGFSIVFKRHVRARILRSGGTSLANWSIAMYKKDEDEESLKTLKAVTYNIDNGKVSDTKLDKSSIFDEKVNSRVTLRKFTFPKVKEGSIIDLEYKIISDFTDYLRNWDFQREFPVLLSEYVVSIPEFFEYTTLTQGYQPFVINERKDRLTNFTLEETRVNAGITSVSSSGAGGRTTIDAQVSDYRWVMKDVPALKEEGFTSTINNHVARIKFQIASIKTSTTHVQYQKSWADAMDDLLRSPEVAYTVNNRDNSWMTDESNEALRGAKDDLDKAQRIFYYIRDNITSAGRFGYVLSKPLKSVLKTRNGTSAEINLLLTAMLLKAGLTAEPVLVSTRSNGFIYKDAPIMNQFNHVISVVTINGQRIFMDASEPKIGFGKIPLDCYNGQARIINAAGTAVDFSPELNTESKVTQITLVKDGSNGLKGSIDHRPGYFESLSVRQSLAKTSEKKIFESLGSSLSSQGVVSDARIDSLNVFEAPLSIHFNVNLKPEGDIWYLNPMLIESWRANLLKSPQRFYPIELPYKIDQFCQVKIDVPEGYTVEELPQQSRIKLNNEEDGLFEYLISESNGVISLTSRLRIKRTVFGPAEYHTLREFFAMVVKKHSEQIVFKKK